MKGLTDELVWWIGAGIAAAIVMGYLAKKATGAVGAAAGAVADAVNPVSDGNIFYGGVNAVGGAVVGDQNFSLGTWVYDALHPSTADDPNAPQNKVVHPVTTTGASATGIPTVIQGNDRNLIH